MNWTAPAFIGWFIAAVAFYKNNAGQRPWIRIYGKISLVFIVFALLVVHIVAVLPNFYIGRGDYYAGWKELAARVESVGTQMPAPYFIAGSEYKIPSEMAFYLKGHPETVGNNIIGQSGLQYDYWTQPDTIEGYNAIYIYEGSSDSPIIISELGRYFDKIDQPEILNIEKGAKLIRTYYIYRCYNYLGISEGE
jgi:hypothetical protein